MATDGCTDPRTLGVERYSLGLVLVVALPLARWQRLGDSGLQVPTTALLAMTIAGGLPDTLLMARVVETLVGAVIGAGINLWSTASAPAGREGGGGYGGSRGRPATELDS